MEPLRDSEAIDLHLAHLERRNLRPSTIVQRRRTLRRLQAALSSSLMNADTHDLSVWWATLDTQPESRATDLAHVSGFYRWAVGEGLIGQNPARQLIRPRVHRRLPRPIPADALALALDGAPERIYPWLVLAAYAGLRAQEISGLRAEHVLWDRGLLIIEDGKGGEMGVVPMHEEVARVLSGPDIPTAGWLFPRRDTLPGPTPPHSVSHLSNNWLHSLGIPNTLHTLRHRFATDVYRLSGRDLRQTQELLRHRSPVTTAIYTWVDPGEKAATVALLYIKRPE